MGTEAEGVNGSSVAAWAMFPWAREREETTEPVRWWAGGRPGLADIGEFPPMGVAVVETEVLMPGSRGALLEGEKGS